MAIIRRQQRVLLLLLPFQRRTGHILSCWTLFSVIAIIYLSAPHLRHCTLALYHRRRRRRCCHYDGLSALSECVRRASAKADARARSLSFLCLDGDDNDEFTYFISHNPASLCLFAEHMAHALQLCRALLLLFRSATNIWPLAVFASIRHF